MLDDMPGGRPPKSQKRTPFGQRLFDARTLKGLSQHEVAAAIGVRQPSYADWERTVVSLRPDVLPKLAQVLGVSIDHLLGVKVPPRKSSGPVGKLQKALELASSLPRYHQQRIIALVEDVFAAYHAKASRQHD
jgi:transcriptional regulator with XRE-family HTH domain